MDRFLETADLEKALRLYEGFQEGGQVSPLQVDQVKSTLLNARNTVLKDMQDGAQERVATDTVVHAVLRGLRTL